MSLRRDFRRLLRAATRWLKADANRRSEPDSPATGDGGKGADALGKALSGLHSDPVLAELEKSQAPSYAHYGEPGFMGGEPAQPKPDPSKPAT